jgi:hypothetical protein
VPIRKLSRRQKFEIASLENETARLRADNLETEKIILPREFPVYGRNNDAALIIKQLEEFAGTKVWVQQAVPDFEISRLTVSLMGLFRAVKWTSSIVGPAETGVGPLAILEGIRVLVRYPYDKFPPPQNSLPDKLSDAAALLVKRLQQELGDNFFSVHWEYLTLPMPNGVPSPPSSARVPDDTMLVLVGMKPISALISEKNAKARSPPKEPSR